MRKRSIFGLSLPVVASALVGCGVASDLQSHETLETASEATNAPTTYNATPNPTPTKWQASKVDLLAADAWAQCSYTGASTTLGTGDADNTDAYLTSVAGSMATAMGTSPAAPSFASWVAFRGDKSNYTWGPSDTPSGVVLDTSVYLPSLAGLSGNPAVAVRTAIVNYCIAQRLRNASPGASVLQALAMPLQEQRQLLQIIHERSQIAMLQYAMLGLAITTPSRATGLVKSLGLKTEEGQFLTWTQDPANAGLLTSMGKDFAGVIQLDLAATQELADLFSHQAAADEARGGISTSISDALWGAGSWRQRLMGLLYGGDPLVGQAAGAVGQDSAPGVGNTLVYSTHPSTDSLYGMDNPSELNWPSKTELPYATVSVSDVHVPILLGIAQQLDREQQRNGAAAIPVVALKLGAQNSLGCRGTDVATSATQLYSTVEALLETKDCEAKDASGNCTAVSPSTIQSNMANYQNFVLWKKHRISPSHATTLVMELDDLVGDSCPTPWPEGARVGALDVFGGVSPATVNGDSSWRSISSDTRFTPRAIEEMAPLFARLARFRMPRTIDYAVPLDQQGLVSGVYFNNAERKRALGTVQAFAATRDALVSAAEQTSTQGGLYLKHLKAMSDALTAAIGDSSLSISAHAETQSCGKPAGAFGPDVSPKQAAILSQTVGGAFIPSPAAGATYDWDVDVTVPPSDDWWNNGLASKYKLVAIPKDPHASTFARYSPGSREGKSLATIAASGSKSTATPTTDTAPTDGGNLIRWHFKIALPRSTRWTFLVTKGDDLSNPDNARLLASNVTMASFTETLDGTNANLPSSHSYYTATAVSHARPLEGQNLAFGGHFGIMAMRTLAPDTADPTQPAFDGFGLPRHFVPGPDPHALAAPDSGGNSAQPLALYHLSLATQMAQNAQAEVQKVLTGLLQQTSDQATAAAAAKKSSETIQLQQAELCGSPPGGVSKPSDPEHPADDIPYCDTKMEQKKMDFTSDFVAAIQKTTPNFPDGVDANNNPICTDAPPDLSIPSLKQGDDWKNYVPGLNTAISVVDTTNGVPNPDLDAKRKQLSTWLDCKTYKLLQALDVTAMLARPVRIANELAPGSNTAPGFLEVNGGKLQTAFIQQWASLAQARNIVNEIITQNGATKQHLVAFVAAFQAVQGKASQNCSPGAMADAAVAGLSAGVSIGCMPSASVSFSAGPLIAQQQKCNDMKGDIDSAAQTAVANLWDAMAAVMAQASKLTDASRAIQDSSASIAQLVNQTNVASKQAALDQEITDATLQTSFGLWRNLHNADVAEAQSLLASARLEALIARRAIESTYVVDMSTMLANETFVPAPKTWADDVYTMDLDMAAAAGITVGTTTANSVYPYALTDYVNNLQGFVNGFFQGTRNILPADQKTFVINLQGPDLVDANDVTNWSFYCPTADGNDGKWIEVAPAGTQDVWSQRLALACPQRVLRAKVMFSLDPWGRLGMTAPHSLDLSKQYNMRWEKFAVNLQGTSVCDVPPAGTQGVDRLCFTTNELPTSLTQIAPAWTTDYNANWAPLGFVTGTLQDVSALSLGQTFQANGWNDPNYGSWVSAVARRGLTDRPMGGLYELELNPGSDPSLTLQHLDGVQILFTASYWQKP